jgi:Tfp pilus assembly protein PilX
MSGFKTQNQLWPNEAWERLGKDDRGVAMLTVMLIMLMLTVMGVAAMTVSSVENNIAGMQRTTEAAGTAAESCLGTGVNIIQQTIMAGSLPAAFATPGGPVGNVTTLNSEIMGQSDNNPDTPSSVPPNMTMSAGAFSVKGDIDRLYAKAMSGGSQVFAGAYEGYGQGAGAGGIEIYYRIACVASNTATGTSSKTTAVYACVTAGEGCQRKL